MTESTKIDYVSIVQDLRDEADLCRNETATDIADLLDDAASCIVAMKSQFVALRADLAAAQEELERVRDKCNEHYMALAAAQEARQRAEALAESYRKDAERYRWLKAENSSMESWRASVRIALDAYTEETGHQGDELDAAIDAAREGK